MYIIFKFSILCKIQKEDFTQTGFSASPVGSSIDSGMEDPGDWGQNTKLYIQNNIFLNNSKVYQ